MNKSADARSDEKRPMKKVKGLGTKTHHFRNS
jgi:hypothetical protein